MRERVAIIDGVRTPMARAGTLLSDVPADDLAAFVVREVLSRTRVEPREIDEVVIGNVAQPANAANIARVIALKAGIPSSVPAFTVHRNCASGMESITTATLKILSGYGKVFIAGGVESMSNIPLLFPKEYAEFANRLSRAKSFGQRLSALAGFRMRMLKPEVALLEGLTDPVSGLIMGLTAENLSREFHIGREEQDELALLSHQRASAAQRDGTLAQEILPVPTLPSFDKMVTAGQRHQGKPEQGSPGQAFPVFRQEERDRDGRQFIPDHGRRGGCPPHGGRRCKGPRAHAAGLPAGVCVRLPRA